MLSIYNKISDYIIVVNYMGEVVFCNESFLRKLNYKNEDLLNSNIVKIISNKDINNLLKESVETNKTLEFYSKSNEIVKVDSNISVEKFNNEKSIVIIGKEAQSSQYTMEMLEDLLDNIDTCAFVSNSEGEYLYVNKPFTNMLNKRREDIIGTDNSNHWEANIHNQFDENNKEVFDNKSPKIFNEQVKVGDSTYWYESYKAPIFDANNKPKYIVATAKNVNLQKTISEELYKNYNRTVSMSDSNGSKDNNVNLNKILSTIGENVLDYTGADGISILLYDKDKEGLIPSIKMKDSAKYLKYIDFITLKGFNMDAYKYSSYCNGIISRDEISNVSTLNYNCIDELSYSGNYIIELYDEFIGIICLSYSNDNYPKFNSDEFMKYICNKIAMVIKNVRLSEEIAIENKKREYTEKEKRILEEAVQLETVKNEFFSNISHEFRTPINIILGTMQVIDKNIENDNIQLDTLKRCTKYIKQNSYRLLRLVNNLIDISRMDIGFYELRCSNQNIISIIEDITLSVVDYTQDNKINLIFDTNEEEVTTYCDPDKIERIMLNLLSNAIKYTPENGFIEVKINSTENEIIVSVKDNGVGIPQDKLDVIFDRFGQADGLFNRKCEGSGIGLSLVKNLIEMHGGNINVNSEVNKGSEFIFTIPIKLKEEKEKNENDFDRKYKHVERCNIEFSDIYSI